MSDRAVLSPASRADALAALDSEVFDIVVVGGGITGAGAALDAASRGLRVALVERHDLAAGTSSRSSKLIHGGLRYLERLDIRLVMEALHERGAMLGEVAPGLVEPVAFVIPLTAPIWQRAYLGAGVALYDLLASARGANPLPRHRHLGRRGMRRVLPGVRADSVRGGIMFWDAQVDDARHTMLVARTAALHGAVICTRTEVTALLRDRGAVSGVEVTDVETGVAHHAHARCVVNATGVWSDDIERLVGDEIVNVRAAKGVHIVVPRDRIDANAGMVLRTEKSVLFVIPWHDHWLIGTTDTPWALDRDHPVAPRADIDYLLDRVNVVLAHPLSTDDIVGVFAGLRPLVDLRAARRRAPRSSGTSTDTTKISREHVVRTVVPGLVTIAGGKYTTYRRMAADAIDAAAVGITNTPSRTRHLAIVGSRPPTTAVVAENDATWQGLDAAVVAALTHRHGPLVDELRSLIAADVSLTRPLGGAPDLLRVEVVHAVMHEGARHLDDVLARRTRLAITRADRGVGVAREIALLMAPPLGWDTETVAREVATYVAAVASDLEAEGAPDDATAMARRPGANLVAP